MKCVAIIQARMGSTRLPGKVLRELAGTPVLEKVYERVKRVQGLSDVVVATTVSPEDDDLERFCRTHAIPVHRGSEHDVLDRFYQVARELRAEAVMRITADCPFIDPRQSGRVLAAFAEVEGCEYACNIEPPFLPDGMDTEVVRFATLERIWREATDVESREHVTLYIRRHMPRFNTVCVGSMDPPQARCSTDAPVWSGYRLTLDEPADYEQLQALAEILERRGQFGYVEEIVAILEQVPDLVRLDHQRLWVQSQ